MNNCKNPLRLSFHNQEYRVNKPGDQDGEYVDKAIADELLLACEWAVIQFKRLADEGKYPEFMPRQNDGVGIIPLVVAINLAKK